MVAITKTFLHGKDNTFRSSNSKITERFIRNIKDFINSETISERIEGIDLNELLIRLGD